VNGRLLGVVLCGGQSRRMGRDKANLQLPDGKTFLQHAVDRIEPITDDVVISGGEIQIDNVHKIPDSVFNQGPALGIAESLAYAGTHRYSACLVTPVDVPALGTDDLRQLCENWHQTGQLTVAKSDRIEPLIGIYPVDLTDNLQQLAKSNDRSLFRWIQSQDYSALRFPIERVRNINTPEDYSNHGR